MTQEKQEKIHQLVIDILVEITLNVPDTRARDDILHMVNMLRRIIYD